MKRNLLNKLISWKTSKNRMPLIIMGARQVGKTYLLEEFGKNEFVQYHYINFETNKSFNTIFEESLDPIQIIKDLSLKLKKDINTKTDILIFDEIQSCPQALTSLKYFCENMPELAVCCAGSLIGIMLSKESFPVGKVDFLNLYPMNFEEFLLAIDPTRGHTLYNNFLNTHTLSLTEHEYLTGKLKEYFFTGGMPQVVSLYKDQNKQTLKEYESIRHMQKIILKSYYADIAKHSGKINAMHISHVFENIPLQLAREIDGSVSRYRFKDVIPGKKGFTDLSGPIDWLKNAGLIHKIHICNKIEHPLKAFCKPNIFKLYYFDIGLLSCTLNLSPEIILAQNFGMTRGFLTENFVCQEMIASESNKPFSLVQNQSEIEFLITCKDKIIPVEVKAGNRTRAKSLNVYLKNHKPSLAIILSLKPAKIIPNRIVQHIPSFFSGKLVKLCNDLFNTQD